MPPKKRKNVKQTKITDMMETKPKKAQILVEPKSNNEKKQPEKFSACEQLPTESIFPYTLEEFTKRTNINDVITNYIRQKYPTALETYLTEPEIMSRVYKTYKVYYRNPERRCFAPMKYVHFNDDCEGNIKEPVLGSPDENKQLCEYTDNEAQCVKENLITNISQVNCVDGSPNKNNNIENINDEKSIEEKIKALRGLKSIMSSNCNGHHEESNLPVSFEKFKKYTSFHSVIDQICLSITQTGVNISKQELLDPNKLLRSYYKAFYIQPDIRRIFPLKIKPCPGRIKEKVLKYPEIGSGNKESTIRKESGKNVGYINPAVEEPSNKEIKLGKKTKVKNKDKFSLALHLKAAKDNALNKSKLHQQNQNKPKPLSSITKSNELNNSANDFSMSVQKQDYTQKNTRESAIHERTLNEKIEVLSGLKSFLLPNNDDNETDLQTHNPPVSLEIFKKYVLYNEVIDQIYQDMVHTDNSLLILNPSEEKFLNRNNLLQSYYKAFYFQPNIRKLYRLRIKPCPAHLKAKLLSLPKKIYNIGTDNDSMKSNENESSDNINVTVIELQDNSTKLHQNNMKCSSLQIKAAKDNAELKSKKHELNSQTTPTKSSDSSSPAKVFMPKRDNSKESKQKSPKALLKERDETQNNRTHFTSAQINSDDEQHELDVASPKYHPDFTSYSLDVPVLDEFAEKKNEIASELPEKPQLTTKYDDSKFSLKFQNFLMGTNILDLLAKECNTTDDDLENLAFEYYIKFVTNSKSQDEDLLKNLMIHANKKLIKQFLTIYKQNEEDQFHEVEATKDTQRLKASKPINKMPVSIAEFRKYTHYKEVVIKILKEKAKGDDKIFQKLRKNKFKCKKVLSSFYTKYYVQPSIRNKYNLRLKEMPQHIKDKILEIPAMSTPVTKNKNDHKNSIYINKDEPISDDFLLMYIAKKVPDASKHSEILRRIKDEADLSEKQSRVEIISVETIKPANVIQSNKAQGNENTLVEPAPIAPDKDQKIFNRLFEPIPLNCTQSYLLRFCTGPKQSVIQTMMHITFEDFCQFTYIYQLPDIYKDRYKLFKVYESTIVKKIWPFNLYMRISDMFVYLLKKHVEFDLSDLRHISPKFLHWTDLAENTDFDEIVRSDYFNMNGRRIEHDEELEWRESFYSRCWMEDDWIWQIPKIIDKCIQDKINITKANVLAFDEDAEEKGNEEDAYISLESYLKENAQIQKAYQKEDTDTEQVETDQSFNVTNSPLTTDEKIHDDSLTPNALNTAQLENIQYSNDSFSHISITAEDISSIISHCVNFDNGNDNEENNVVDFLSSESVPPEDLLSRLNKINELNVNSTDIIKPINDEPGASNISIYVISDDSDQTSNHSFEEIIIDLVENDVDDLPSPEVGPNKASTSNINKTETIKTIKDELTAINKPVCTKSDDNNHSCHLLEKSRIDLVESDTDKLTPESQIIENMHKSSTPVIPQLSDLSSQIIKNEIIANCEAQNIDSNSSGTATAAVKDKNLITISIPSEALSKLLPYLDGDTISTTGVKDNKLTTMNSKAFSNLLSNLEGDTVSATTVALTDDTNDANQKSGTVLIHKRKLKVNCNRKNKKLKTNKITDVVPQLTHGFRPLPLETITKSTTNQNIEPPVSMTTSSTQSSTLTVSQALGVDNTLFNDTELLKTVDQHQHFVRKQTDTISNNVVIDSNANVPSEMSSKKAQPLPSISSHNTNQANENKCLVQVTEPKLQQTLFYHNLFQFHFVLNLTAEHIARYQYSSSALDQIFIEASIYHSHETKLNRGDVVRGIFSHIKPNILQDVLKVLYNLKEYHFYINDYNSVNRFKDLRHRILFYFMYSNLSFCHCRLTYEATSHAYAECTPLQAHGSARTEPIDPSCLLAAIKPSIREKLKKLKKDIKDQNL